MFINAMASLYIVALPFDTWPVISQRKTDHTIWIFSDVNVIPPPTADGAT